MKKFTLVLKFYATVLVPLVYGFNLWLIGARNGNNFSVGFRVMGVILGVIGIVMWIVSFKSLGKSFGVLPRKQRRIRAGIYGVMKHPMYVGIGLTFGGLALANGSLLGLLFAVLVLGPLLIIRAMMEEKMLS